jgi:hypothetical protein
MGDSEKNEAALPIRDPEFKLEITAATAINCLQRSDREYVASAKLAEREGFEPRIRSLPRARQCGLGIPNSPADMAENLANCTASSARQSMHSAMLAD